jgi:hypothetical protein
MGLRKGIRLLYKENSLKKRNQKDNKAFSAERKKRAPAEKQRWQTWEEIQKESGDQTLICDYR